jgi:two-component system OmpR family response regulator
MKSKKSHILLVEDEEHLAFGVKFNLEAEGYSVVHVPDGPSALRQVKEAEPGFDLIILDLMMPGMSGYVVCKTLRDAGIMIPVLILSARSLSEDRAAGFDVGANQYLTKPFELDELISRVKNLLTFQAGKSPVNENEKRLQSFTFGNARINFETFEVFVNDRPVKLTALQLRLLEYFIQNRDRVIPREELLENVWEMPRHMNTRAPDQFLRQLRKTFEPEPSNPRYFLTIRDVGYRFTPE